MYEQEEVFIKNKPQKKSFQSKSDGQEITAKANRYNRGKEKGSMVKLNRTKIRTR